MPTQDEFKQQVTEAIAGRLDLDYVDVKLSAAKVTESGDVEFGGKRFSGVQPFAAHLIETAPDALVDRSKFYASLQEAAKTSTQKHALPELSEARRRRYVSE